MQVTLTPENIELAEEYKKKSIELFTGFAASTTTVVNSIFKHNFELAIIDLNKQLKRKKK